MLEGVTTGTVEVEVSYNRERVRLSTGVAVLKQQWQGNQVVNHTEAGRLNDQIRRVYDGIREKMSSIPWGVTKRRVAWRFKSNPRTGVKNKD